MALQKRTAETVARGLAWALLVALAATAPACSCGRERERSGSLCGNGNLDLGEECDDRGRDDGDGCSAGCDVEANWTCVGLPSACTCPDGFLVEAGACSDVDECGDPEACAETALCTNAPGSFECNCPEGWIDVSGDASFCAEDECVAAGEPCRCGYVIGPMAECVDVDECGTAMHDCLETETCTNTAGGFECVPAPLQVRPVYASHGNWNDYVLNDDPTADAYHQDDEPCTGAETGGPGACIHAGLKLRAEVPESFGTSCLGLSMRDALGAFDWVCDDSEGMAIFHLRGFRSGKGLRDLVTGAGWVPNRVILNDGTGDVFESVDTAWWSNPVLALPPAGSLDVAGAIYVFEGAEMRDVTYTIAADRIALVTLDEATLVGAQIEASGRRFLWMEGQFDGRGDSSIISWSSVAFSALHRVYTANAAWSNIALSGSSNNVLTQVTASNTDWDAIALSNSHANSLSDIVVSSTRWTGVALRSSSQNVLSQLTVAHGDWNGIELEDANDNAFHNVLAVQNDWQGVSIDWGGAAGTSTGNLFSQTVTTSVEEDGSGTQRFASNLILGGSCTGGTCPGSPGNTADVQETVDFSGAVVGPITADDAVNDSDVMGQAEYATIDDWTQFENRLRAWGPAAPGQCTEGVCQIWDWSLSASDAVLRNRTGDGRTANAAFTDAAACPAEASGDEATTDTGSTFLEVAVELLADGVGDEDGLCESSEVCLYTPNFGAYQGHGGDFVSHRCVFSGGAVTNVTLLGYPVNGR